MRRLVTSAARSHIHVQQRQAGAAARCLYTSRRVQSAELDEVAAKLTHEAEHKGTRNKAGMKQMYVAIESIETEAELEQLQEVLAHYRRLNKTGSPKLTEKVIAACLEHNKAGLAGKMVVDKLKYGLFPTVAEYGGLMGAILADPHADPAQVVQLFETLILERGLEEPDVAIFDLAIDACVRKGEAGYTLAAGDLMTGVVMDKELAVSLSAERHAAVAEALVAPGVASDDGVATAVSVLQGHDGGPAALSADAKGYLAAFVASSSNAAVLEGFAGFSDTFKAEANVEATRLAAEAAEAAAAAAAAEAAAAAAADADASAEEGGENENNDAGDAK